MACGEPVQTNGPWGPEGHLLVDGASSPGWEPKGSLLGMSLLPVVLPHLPLKLSHYPHLSQTAEQEHLLPLASWLLFHFPGPFTRVFSSSHPYISVSQHCSQSFLVSLWKLFFLVHPLLLFVCVRALVNVQLGLHSLFQTHSLHLESSLSQTGLGISYMHSISPH